MQIYRSLKFSDPCSYGTVAWLCLVQEIPPYACVVGFTLCHLLIFVERCVSTRFLRTYQSLGFGVIAIPILVMVSYRRLTNFTISSVFFSCKMTFRELFTVCGSTTYSVRRTCGRCGLIALQRQHRTPRKLLPCSLRCLSLTSLPQWVTCCFSA